MQQLPDQCLQRLSSVSLRLIHLSPHLCWLESATCAATFMVHAGRSTVVVPKTIEQATSRLTSLDAIATATGWERAAIVAALVRDGDGTGASSTS